MKSRFAALSALAILAVSAANATPSDYLFNNYVSSTYATVADGYYDGFTYLADSFTSSSSFNAITVSLLLSADKPSDGQSLSVYLVPDSNSGSVGVAGKPDYAAAQFIGTINDSSLPQTTATAPSAPTATVSAVLTSPAAPNQEYWVEVVLGSSSAAWWANSDDAGMGTTGQSAGYGKSAADLVDNVSPDSMAGAYVMEVSVPEPATIALLGTAVSALGLSRRRKRT